ncbi:MAG: LuxR C-terminal-related transcriptional regulator [Anaerocolumna aminovalerica]|jgi:LuxR family maltose regulon positive regulatory protein|uniref:LuxR C-terminal-related transcriptional regulator n=1 Tax=Anaerocolumna aminovalerica TaxID=1527 RepID=UPI00290A5CA1|nr:LuxR C-terminal-related transcriptional regulator [Anaerocolumna aminovalerica]MDU6266342.1 LuxR C-terminal-related transcriptional regulator [Anaerocolumna aminovalerica]
MQKTFNQQNKYYFSDRLKKQLNKIHRYPLTIVEAPSGFGKTTAVREYLTETLPHNACEYWYTCLGEPASMAWKGICELISNVNDKVADDLKNLKMPTMDTLYYMSTYLRDVQCKTETYLIIDNYRLVNCDVPHELISVFSMHGSPNLHLIFITQQLEAKQQLTIHNNNIHKIDSSSFFFDKEGTASLFRMEGVRLTSDEVQNVYTSTEGWVSAIKLQIINFKENGTFDYTADIEQLVETAIWNRLTYQEKDFLLSVSILDSFTMHQAAIMMGKEMLPEKIEDLLKNNDFIRYIPDKNIFSMHSILQDYLRNRFLHNQTKDYQNQTYRKAGQACAVNSQYYPAAKFFYKVRDFDAILSLPFSREYLDNQKDIYQPEYIAVVVNECPEDTLCKHPLTMIVFGYQALVCGQFKVFKKLCQLLQLTVQNGMGFNQEELRRINGEYKLMESMKEFNYLPKMHEGKIEAWRTLGKPTDMIKASTPWVFATTSALNMFWRESGELENELQQMDEFSPSYYKLANGHGAGSHSLMRAEAMLMRGEDNYAEILCHKALYEARNYQQTSICICTELVLARIAILRGDAEGYFMAIKNIQGYAKENSNLYVLRMVEHCMSIISLVLGIKDYIAPWVYDIESIKKVLYAPVVPFAQMLHLKLLLMDKRYNEFYGICQHAIDTSRNPVGNIKYMMPQVYLLIFTSIAKRNNGDNLEAQKYLKEALAIALPDQIYLPFAQQECMEDFLSEMIIDSCDNSFDALKSLCKRQNRGAGIIKKAIFQEKSPLTPREREIAQLARDRLTAREISDKLYISETTVRATLRSVYNKLDIHSKTELASKEF